MRRALIEEQNRYLVEQQRQFRLAADIVTRAWTAFAEVQAIAVIGSVARPLWKEIPRFPEFRREGIEVWHECRDLDIALWVTSQHRLGELRRAAGRALREAYEAGKISLGVVGHQLDVFLFEPCSDRYLGRLCWFNSCPKGKRECLVPGCGETPFNQRVDGFEPHADLLAPSACAMLYQRETGLGQSALELPPPGAE
jgi:hypothetical protein